MRTLPRTLAVLATAVVLALGVATGADAAPIVSDPAPIRLTGLLPAPSREDALHDLEMCSTSVGRLILGDDLCALARRVVYGRKVCRRVRSQSRGRTVVRTVCRRVYSTTSGR